MRTEHFLQRRVQQVGGGVIVSGGLAPGLIDFTHHAVTHLKTALPHQSNMGMTLLGVLHLEARITGNQQTLVPHLPAGLGIERCGVEIHHAVLSGLKFFNRHTLAQQRGHLGVIVDEFVTGEGRGLDAELVQAHHCGTLES